MEQVNQLFSHQPRMKLTNYSKVKKSKTKSKLCTVTSPKTKEKSHLKDSKKRSSKFSLQLMLRVEAWIFHLLTWSFKLSHQKKLRLTSIVLVERLEQVEVEHVSLSSLISTNFSFRILSRKLVSKCKKSAFPNLIKLSRLQAWVSLSNLRK